MSHDEAAVSQPTIVSLRQVASWDLENLDAPCSIKASVPAMQRGLVWSPQQVEMLWDSIFRGFPIGCLVVSKKVEQQERSGKEGITHHLLDGQQRCNAITLGFSDPFAEQATQVRGNKSQSILWLDLAPMGTEAFPESNLSPNSTRQFLTRVTTMAHPWGFNPDDATSNLSASKAREAVEWEYEGRPPPGKKPSSLELFPWHTNAPVPLGWLLEEIGDAAPQYEAEFWRRVEKRLTERGKEHRWPALALNYFKQPNIEAQRHEIYCAILRAAHMQLVILEAPGGILSTSRQEKSQANPETGNITSIEHLFQRLNGQGTMLEGEELAYSMIKAYWPGAADAIDAVDRLRFPASHLVSLGIRAALTDPEGEELARPFGLSRLRTIAVAKAPSVDYTHRQKIETFLGVTKTANATHGAPLAKACARVDGWLLYDQLNAPNGLPPVLVSGFARGSAAIYLFLLHIADSTSSTNPHTENEWRRLLPGMATLIHWFADSAQRLEIGDLLKKATLHETTPAKVREGIASAFAQKLIIRPRDPADLDAFLELPNGDLLKDWKWRPSLSGTVPENEHDELHEKWWLFLEGAVRQRELLLFAQRDYLHTQFPEYDPSRKDLWENTNRPWDFDHLHASAYFYNAKSGDYADLCREWGNCIGNLRAWPFEENRSDHKETARSKLGGRSQEIAWSLLETEAELDAFSHGDSARHEERKARELCEAIKSRFLRIYRNWYESTNIRALLTLGTGQK